MTRAAATPLAPRANPAGNTTIVGAVPAGSCRARFFGRPAGGDDRRRQARYDQSLQCRDRGAAGSVLESFRVSLKHGKTPGFCFDAFPTPNRCPLRLETIEGVMQFKFCSALEHEAGEGFRMSLVIFDEPPPSAPLCAPPHANPGRALRTRLPPSSRAADHGRIVGHGAPDLRRTRLASRSHPILLMQSITKAPNAFLRSAK